MSTPISVATFLPSEGRYNRSAASSSSKSAQPKPKPKPTTPKKTSSSSSLKSRFKRSGSLLTLTSSSGSRETVVPINNPSHSKTSFDSSSTVTLATAGSASTTSLPYRAQTPTRSLSLSSVVGLKKPSPIASSPVGGGSSVPPAVPQKPQKKDELNRLHGWISEQCTLAVEDLKGAYGSSQGQGGRGEGTAARRVLGRWGEARED
ncbi:hypothetical protein NMY22_g15310 [Coprinellus aureogranulatus]|nr:hypothetical protein NMY22_g15310 [Coprinellus aureogranulatus]